jgi:predicted molibdopterin-dependent oxidoreductase YjgC
MVGPVPQPVLEQRGHVGPHRHHGADRVRRPDGVLNDVPATHTMQMMRYVQDGSIRMLWVSGISLPELHRVRSILAQKGLFLVVQDVFLTETARLAEVVLPAATWGEKAGTFTNADRTVHFDDSLAHGVVHPRANRHVRKPQLRQL